MEFSRQEYWSELPFLPPGDLPNPGLESRSPALQADSLPSEPPATVFDNCNPKQLAYCLYPRSIINCWRKALTLDFLSVQFSSVAQSCPTLCDPNNRSTRGLPVHHQLPEFTQTHVHRVSDAVQPSHPLSSPSPPAPNPSQHQSLFQ